ncbi:MAG: hypothetical protein M0Q16_05640 [Candidatus Cloacimonetes bacterium]|nr:hypothetical protein [Candidatus Cloacimonadota bacterium]MCK9184834.1 hypothetical protein [Candidatus Cloacimonadota bacterium]
MQSLQALSFLQLFLHTVLKHCLFAQGFFRAIIYVYTFFIFKIAITILVVTPSMLRFVEIIDFV